ncbi:hypothetical protein IV38_GL000088 [Lactobacillus selangorensis]|uniref:HTH cro/C1-type domain-containing protein n=1 Tax=Lactobacillus selangorensis TaxID=81857 RepID=A0A0R2G238_9LACO|nr:helix-turn-helix transcriptional regulator [Lactobacillus selangorensis]KRN29208.1 hypothetical protein IV38_GL000088 [Lactobacillus selangorensis]KRN31434.1 hypothetical protein IV40_GL001430 [Lactobacillus selangorensis]
MIELVDLQAVKVELQKAIDRQQLTKDQLAHFIHTTPSNISNFLNPNRGIPDERLRELSEALDDVRFRFVVASYFSQIDLLDNSNEYNDDPQSRLAAIDSNELSVSEARKRARELLSKSKKTSDEFSELQKCILRIYSESKFDSLFVVSAMASIGADSMNEAL